MGLAFKPNIDDLRESPALWVFQQLVAAGTQPLAVEPNLKTHASVSLTPWQEAAEKADLVVYLVAHQEFKDLEVKGQVLDFCGVTQA
jgi:UDP-N-acetyl-D-mannosaminuronate dehydrogenase